MKIIFRLVLGCLAIAPAGMAFGQSPRDDRGGKNQKPMESNARPQANPKAPDLDFAADEGREAPVISPVSAQPVWLYWSLGAAAVVGGGVLYLRAEQVKSPAAPARTTQVFTND